LLHTTLDETCSVCDAGNDFCSPQKQQLSSNSSENTTMNGTVYTPERTQPPRDSYISSHEVNEMPVNDSQRASAANTTENMPPLCIVQDLDIVTAQPDDSSDKQMVRSLLRAMLAKPRPTDISSLIELTMKNEFDSGSEETVEQPLGGDGKDDDSQSANETIARDDAIKMESETEQSTTTKHNWSPSAVVSPEKASRCPYCLKMFRYRSSYRRHVKIHEGIFSHECSVCSRKFTRKEHYIRHKCDRRPNKPYNVTHEAFRCMTAGQKATARHVLSREALAHSAVNRFESYRAAEPLEAPLELTCQSTGKQLLFTGGSVSSVSMECSSYPVCSPVTITSSSTSVTSAPTSVTSTSTGTGIAARSLEIISGFDTSILSHNESRRKSSTPRKVVSAGSEPVNSTTQSDICRLNFPIRHNNLNSVPVSVID